AVKKLQEEAATRETEKTREKAESDAAVKQLREEMAERETELASLRLEVEGLRADVYKGVGKTAPASTGSNSEGTQAELARLNAELSEKDAALSELAVQTLAFTEASKVRTGTLYKQSKYLKSWERRTVTLDPLGNLTWDGGAGHKGFVTLREGDRVVPVNQLDFQVEARDRKIAFRAGNAAEAGEWMEAIGEFVGGDTPLPPPPR
ncbi:hypothetical protein TeGR_g1698, partial [Tetraparma gracilis]